MSRKSLRHRLSLSELRPFVWSLVLLLSLNLSSSGKGQAASEKRPFTAYNGLLSTLSIEAKIIGKDWTGPTGIVIDDFSKIENFPNQVKPIVEAIAKQSKPARIIRCADFTYRKTSAPVGTVVLRVFLFRSPDDCKAWWKRKYQYKGWEKHYKKVDNLPYQAVDSKQVKKRAVSFGNVWMTCHQLHDNQDYLNILQLYIEKVKQPGKIKNASRVDQG